MEASSVHLQAMTMHHSLQEMLDCTRPQKQSQQIQQQQQQEMKKPRPHPENSLRCPRCDSTNTKFCYYNNYSLSQPRYFCKGCRRYWTQGGSLRNVPVGGGCRKNRRSSSSSRLIKPLDHNVITPTTSPFLIPPLPLPPLPYDLSDLTLYGPKSLNDHYPQNPNPNPSIWGASATPAFLDMLRGGFSDAIQGGFYNVHSGGGDGGTAVGAVVEQQQQQEYLKGMDGNGKNNGVVGMHWQVEEDHGNMGVVDPVLRECYSLGGTGTTAATASLAPSWYGLVNSTLL